MKASHAVIIVLLVANLVATIWFGFENRPLQRQSQIETIARHELPEIITDEIREQIFETFKTEFNSKNFDALYGMLGEVAKAQLTKEDAYSTFEKLVKYFHSIEDGAYTHTELIQTQGNTSVYKLHYSVKLSEKSELGTKGNLKVTIGVQGEEFQIYGVRMDT